MLAGDAIPEPARSGRYGPGFRCRGRDFPEQRAVGKVTMATVLEQIGLLMPDLAAAALVVVLAANLGSFLNVVVHRLPLGKSVVHGGSRCPLCGAAIRSYDNVPVLGWLWLRGRCRDCQAPISPRYPLVEAVCGGWVGGIAAVQLLTGGRNLPGPWYGVGRSGIDVLLLHTDWQLLAVTLLHSCLLLILLAWALLEVDRFPVSRRWAVETGLVVVVAVLLAPTLQPAGLLPDHPLWPESPRWLRPVCVSATGAIAAAVLGHRGSACLRQGLLVFGVASGWMAVLAVACLLPLIAAVRQWFAAWPGEHLDGVETVAAGELRRSAILGGGQSNGLDLVVAVGLHQLSWRWIDRLLAWLIPS